MQRWTWISVHYTQTYQWRFPFMLTQFTKTKPRITAHNRYRWYDKSHTSLMFCSLYVWLCNLLKAFELEYHSDLNTLRFVNTRSFQSQTMLYILFIFFWKVHVKHKHNSMHNHYGITNQMFSNEEPGIQPHSFYWFLCSMIMPYREYSLFQCTYIKMTAFIAHHISGINVKHAHWDGHIFAEKHQNLWKRIGVMLCKNRHKLTLLEDLQLPRKTYKSSRRLMASMEDLFQVLQRTYQLLQNTY